MYSVIVDAETLQRQALRLQGIARMGGFDVTLDEAKRGVLGAEEDSENQKVPSLLQTLAEIRRSQRPSLDR